MWHGVLFIWQLTDVYVQQDRDRVRQARMGMGTGDEGGGETYAVGRLQIYGTAKEHVEGGAEQSDSKSIRINK